MPGIGFVGRPGLRPRPAHRHHHSTRPREHRRTHTPEQGQARQAIKECERRLTRYQAALEAGADPAVVTQWNNEAQRDKEAAQTKLDRLPAAARKKESPLNAQQIREITARLGDIARRIYALDADKKGPVYEALGITITHERKTRTATVKSRPSHPYRYVECPRGDSTTDDTAVIAQGRLGEA
ncbi:hypothetical protein ABZ557_26010 [Streptomyces sp. NPDC019645]|uniref:hypothetical protein n=1 Tax=Streptomyces sp. NPDC019645 TaxID=3154786 RepID=UPI0033CA4DDD